ncbi:AsmA family protein [Thiomicrorhabdus lithotrophica]|uniref:AsmA family protein n=1 Tax=Thiomicrorhabdus lithotrophica TaxID=2949997 RepID=A0ABY8C929_9GAMM|nr:AsmA family protein [Thiomicrorhabdus lithotrophica]WEJ62483.1 AsmA family protein [Thiomicrorhabdus lithotrophica]
MTQITLKWTKRASLILAIIPMLIFLGFAGAVSLIDFNQYKPQIEKEVSKLTNRDFRIEGEVKVSVLPFMFHLSNMTLKNPDGFESDNLMTMKEAQIELSLKKLFLERTLKVISLELIEPKFHFIQHADKNNWQDIPLLAGLFPAEKMAKLRYASLVDGDSDAYFKKVISDSPAKSAPISAINKSWTLESLVIKNAQLDYTHKVQDFTVTLKKANLLAFDVLPNQPFKINSDFIYEHSQSPRTFDFQINGRLLLANHYTQLHLTDWHGVFRLQLPEELNKPDIRLTTAGQNLMVDFSHQQIYIKEAQLAGLEAEVLTSFQGEFGANPVFEGVFEASKINLKKWIEHLGLPVPEMVNPKSLTDAAGKFDWRWDGKVLQLKQIDAQLDDAKVSGNLNLPLNSHQPFEFDLVVNNLDTEVYLAKVPIELKDASSTTYYPIPLSAIESLTGQGKLQLIDSKIRHLAIPKVDVELSADHGKVVLAPLDVVFEEGRLQSKLVAGLSANKYEFLWKGQTKYLALNSFAESDSTKLSGVLDSHFVLQTTGMNSQQWIANLQGSLNADVANLKIHGLDVNQLLVGQLALNEHAEVYTGFKNVQVNGRIVDGVFTPKRMQAQSERFHATGNGTLDLNTQQVAGNLFVSIEKPSELLADLKGVAIPLHYEGDFHQPNWSVNIADLSPKLIQQSPVLGALESLLQ